MKNIIEVTKQPSIARCKKMWAKGYRTVANDGRVVRFEKESR